MGQLTVATPIGQRRPRGIGAGRIFRQILGLLLKICCRPLSLTDLTRIFIIWLRKFCVKKCSILSALLIMQGDFIAPRRQEQPARRICFSPPLRDYHSARRRQLPAAGNYPRLSAPNCVCCRRGGFVSSRRFVIIIQRSGGSCLLPAIIPAFPRQIASAVGAADLFLSAAS